MAAPFDLAMLRKLRQLLAGKSVCIIHVGNGLPSLRGECQTIYPVGTGNYTLLLTSGRALDFSPESVTSESVEGPLPALAGGRRSIQLV
jgi:hypothetical protein